MAILIAAGEVVFALPFHVARFFRPTLLSTIGLTQTELGAMQAAYGLAAMLSYFPGGVLADKFAPRVLLSASLLSTGASGLYFASLPSRPGLWALHLFWGVSTILLFWSPLIRATRQWGSSEQQGRAFGFLDSGRGLVAASLATWGVILLGGEPESSSGNLSQIILAYSVATLFVGALVFFALPKEAVRARSPRFSLAEGLRLVLRSRLVPHALVIVAAYCTFKGIDFYSTYAVSVHGQSEIEGAKLATAAVWIRPLAALAAGLVSDRFSAKRLTSLGFALLILFYFGAVFSPTDSGLWMWALVLSTAPVVYSFRVLYYALLEEGAVPLASTGTAVGVVSFLGYTPDFFFPALSGWMVDSAPGASGYQRLFLLLAGFAVLGLVASLFLRSSKD